MTTKENEVKTTDGTSEVERDYWEVMIYGQELISKKFYEVIEHLLTEYEIFEYEAVNNIRLKTDEPEGMFGYFDMESKDIGINLHNHFKSACEMVKDDRLSNMSFKTHLWFGLLTTIIHELIHAMSFTIDTEKMINGDKEKIDEEVRKETRARIADFIRSYDTEPSPMEDEPFFGTLYAEFYVKHIKENSEDWAIKQNEMHNTGFYWQEDKLTCSTFREWYRSAYKCADKIEWDIEPQKLITVSSENKKIITSTLGGTPMVQESTAEENVPAEPVAPLVENQEATNSYFDPESLAALYNAEEPIDIAEGDYYVEDNVAPATTTVEMQAAAMAKPNVAPTPASPVQQPLPTKQPEQITLCKTCNTALNTGAKFCFNCGTSIVETPAPNWTAGLPPTQPATVLPAAPQPPAQNTQQFSSSARRPMRHDLPNYNLTAEQIRACIGEIITRCYQHIFSKCGWRPGQNPSFAPELRSAVQEPISIVGIPCIEQVLIGMDSVDSLTGNFTWCVPAVNGMIRGKVTKDKLLPSYTLYFNFNGHEAKRLIVPQNQWKEGKGASGYSGPAQRAQQGAMIIWLIDGDDTSTGKKWRAKIENGTLDWLI